MSDSTRITTWITKNPGVILQSLKRMNNLLETEKYSL